MKRRAVTLLVLLLFAASCAAPVPPAPTTTPTPSIDSERLQQRLDGLVEELEDRREALHVPGMAIAVVKDDEVVLAEGFGVSNLGTQTPVTPETVFAIGSSTKAFTSTLVGMLVDEGRMNWDDPVDEYLPYFELPIDSDDEGARATIRDVLSHRSGFTRMGLLFASGEIPRQEVLHAATAAEPWAGFREKFYYSNVVYMSAGVAAGETAGTDWDTLVEERIFEPLGMDSSSTSVSQAQEDPLLSLGYLWDEDLLEYEHKPMRTVDNIAPAGAINSNILDMAEWLRLQLGRGEYEGRRLISEEQLEETWTSQIEMAEGISYGLGWMIREWEGQPLIEHGGNVDGFTAQVALLPESKLGCVVLTNASVSPLPQAASAMVWEAVLGEETGTGGAEDYGEYTGSYIADFGPFDDAEFTVLVRNDRLAVDVPDQQVYELKDPDEEGKWYFAVSNEIAVSFDRDESGSVVGMKLYQAGMVFELPRKGVEIAPEIPLEELQKYLGSYRSEDLGVTVRVLIQNNRLAVDWPGEMVFELYPPNREGIWVFRVSEKFTLRFNETPGGRIESLTYYQAGRQYLMERVASESLPSVEEILKLRGTEARKASLEAMKDYRIDGTLRSLQSGVEGAFTIYVSGVGRYRVDSDYGRYGYSRTALNGDRAWVESSFAPFDELRGELLEQARQSHPEALLGDWRDFFDTVELLRADELDGKKVYVLELRRGELPPVTVFVDADTGDVLKSVVVALQEGGIGIPVTTEDGDYREQNGVRIPFRSSSSNEQSGRVVFVYSKIQAGLEIPEDFFVLTPPES